LRSDEPTFREELATSDAVVAVALAQQKEELAKQQAQQLANEAIQTSTKLTTDYPHNINFLKSEVRVYYTLSQLDPAYLKNALETMKKIAVLSPTDAKISYNLGVLYGQNGETQKV
jgi:Flp pilus assembly protein TadD